jgi:hypothetical protein
MVAPLKLNGTAGDLKEITTTEEQYLAYQVGLAISTQLETDTIALTSSATSSTSIGTYSNTFFNQAVGTHPGTSISTGTTNTSVYFKTIAASETGLTRPIKFTTAGTRVDEMGDTDLNEIVDRLIGLIWANSYPGTYYLSTTAPSVDYALHISNVFSDTRTDGASVAYNIYVRQAYAPGAPTTIRSSKLEGGSGSLKEMTDAEIKTTFGQRLKNRVAATANSIGWYQLRSSAQGAPVSGGTWVTKGTATDTKNNTADQAYSAAYSADYTANYETNFSADYLGNYIGDYVGNYLGNYVGNYSGNYTNPNAIQYTRQRNTYRPSANPSIGFYGYYLGNYLGPASYAGTYSFDYTATYSLNYSSDYQGNYVGDYVGTFLGNYTGNYTGNYFGVTIVSGNSTIETYTLYVRTA